MGDAGADQARAAGAGIFEDDAGGVAGIDDFFSVDLAIRGARVSIGGGGGGAGDSESFDRRGGDRDADVCAADGEREVDAGTDRAGGGRAIWGRRGGAGDDYLGRSGAAADSSTAGADASPAAADCARGAGGEGDGL